MRKKTMRITTVLLLAFSVALLTFGVWQEQPLRVMEKAIQVCLECIGIG